MKPTGELIVRAKAISIIVTAVSFLAIGATAPPRTLAAAPVTQECAPPGGVWGPGNAYRAKIRKFADNTAVYMSQNFAATNKDRWYMSATFPSSGGQITNGVGVQNSIVPEGDGYKVTAQARSNYSAHFTCAAAH
jgi:hypothetical protein